MKKKPVAVRHPQKGKEAKPLKVSLAPQHRLQEGGLILILAISVYLLIALVTYHSADPGWSSSGAGGMVANAGGRVGAWLADILITLFGYMAYVFPIMLALSGWFILFGRNAEEESNLRHTLMRLFGFALTLFSSCALFDFHQSFKVHTELLHTGGIFGNLIDTTSISILNSTGTALILTAFLLVGITLFTGWSWFLMLRMSWKGVVTAAQQSWASIRWVGSKYRAWRDRVEEKRYFIEKPQQPIKRAEPSAPMLPAAEREVVLQSTAPKIQKKQQNNQLNLDIKVTDDLPPLALLDEPEHLTQEQNYSNDELQELSKEIERRLMEFGIEAKVMAVHPGPVITRFELDLAAGLKASKVTALARDLARSLSMSSVRVVEVIPGKSYIGLEIPNSARELVRLKELFSSDAYQTAPSPLTFALGKDISGFPVIVDLAKMPHVLIAGTTGSGKSMCINALLFSLLFKSKPEEMRLIMVDPKMLELSTYDGIPHLLTPVVTDMKEAANAFRWCIGEMERRYRLLASFGVRNLAGFNRKARKAIDDGQPLKDPFAQPIEGEETPTLNTLPCIVVVVDELADLMMVTGHKVEELITRLAQKARAVGIHMILATQRPSVDVITGLIKANIPTRISFQVSSRIDSRTILDQPGAEQLLGYGDMLYLPPGTSHPIRVHGGYVPDEEVHRLVSYLKQQGTPDYHEEILDYTPEHVDALNRADNEGERDSLYDQAIAIVTESRRASISYVQRRLRIGYNRAASMIEDMERDGIVTEPSSGGNREVLAPPPVQD